MSGTPLAITFPELAVASGRMTMANQFVLLTSALLFCVSSICAGCAGEQEGDDEDPPLDETSSAQTIVDGHLVAPACIARQGLDRDGYYWVENKCKANTPAVHVSIDTVGRNDTECRALRSPTRNKNGSGSGDKVGFFIGKGTKTRSVYICK